MRVTIKQRTLFKATEPTETGETLELQIKRMKETNQPIEGGAPTIYTARKDGVIPEYDIRSDKWDRALENMEQVSRNRQEQRAEWLKKLDETTKPVENTETAE